MTAESKGTDQGNRTERRGRSRTDVPSVHLRCDGDVYVADNWGLGGARISGYTGRWRPGTTVLVELFLNVVHEHDALPIKAEVVRFEPENNNTLAFRFIDLTAQDIVDFCNIVDESLGLEVAKALG